ncbi:MAG TPA: DUF5979 domain-containing protein, partial [Acidimicrobiia bacterium]|nr:DUF5979 domain-containing protein [Acidimicrobiia bacterium]
TQGAGAGPFTFDLNCNHRPLNKTFTLQPGGKEDFTSVPAGTICEVKETAAGGAKSTTIEESPSDGTADGKITLAPGAQGIVTFTNVFGDDDGGTRAPDNTDIPAPPPAPPAPEEVTVLGETLTTPAPGDPTTPEPAGATLPRTGTDPSALLATGLWTLSAGALSLAAARLRRRS